MKQEALFIIILSSFALLVVSGIAAAFGVEVAEVFKIVSVVLGGGAWIASFMIGDAS